jgi:(S)-mandelate dehydrogenase
VNFPLDISDLRKRAERRLPKAVFDTIDGGSGDEEALRRNRAALKRLAILPRVLTGTGAVNLESQILGEGSSAPLIIGPTGFSGIYWPRGELHMARAAARAGIVYILSCMSSVSLEEVRAESSGKLWFQVYPLKDRELLLSLVERARAAGFEALVITVDTPVMGERLRDARHRLRLPPRASLSIAALMLSRPRWALPFILGYRPVLANFAKPNERSIPLPEFDDSMAWSEIELLKDRWRGPLIIKGVMSADDIQRASQAGASAVIISNHGGRQLDCAASTVLALKAAAQREPNLELYVDGGVRSGADILKFLALGARACLLGRAPLYGLAAGGSPQVSNALDILMRGLARSMKLAGIATVQEASSLQIVTEPV